MSSWGNGRQQSAKWTAIPGLKLFISNGKVSNVSDFLYLEKKDSRDLGFNFWSWWGLICPFPIAIKNSSDVFLLNLEAYSLRSLFSNLSPFSIFSKILKPRLANSFFSSFLKYHEFIYKFEKCSVLYFILGIWIISY